MILDEINILINSRTANMLPCDQIVFNADDMSTFYNELHHDPLFESRDCKVLIGGRFYGMLIVFDPKVDRVIIQGVI